MPFYMLDGVQQLMALTSVVFDEKNTKKVERLGGKPLAKRWKPLPASLFPPNKGGDLFVLGAPIVTPKAWKVLEPLLGAHVEALPLAIAKGERLLLNVLPLADCLDRTKSELWKKKDGSAYRVKAAVLGDGVPDAPIFRVTDVEISPVIVSEEVKRAVEKAKLKGWVFKPVKGGGKAAPKAKRAAAAEPVARAKGDARAVAAAWKRIEAWANANGVDLKLRKGASAAAIAKVEKHLGAPLPDEVSASLALHDGQDEGGVQIDEWTIFGTKDIAREWDIWKKLLDGGAFDGATSKPKRGIKDAWWSARWIPLTGDGSGDHLCADLDPAKGGTPGQIITMWHADARREVVAKGWAAWLEALAKNLEAKRWVYREDDNALAPRKR